MTQPNVADAVALAARAHRDAVDKAGAPYILHPLRVMMKMTNDAARRVAVLHDVLEDTDITADELRRLGYPENEIEALQALTKKDGESYEAFIERAAQNPIAAQVKRADLEDNMDVTRLTDVTPKDAERLAKYVKAWRRLTGGSR